MATELLATSGLSAVTVRDVAEAAGFSTAVVSHYFHNKRELLLLIYTTDLEKSDSNSERALSESGGDLRAYIEAVLPLDDARRKGWKVWLAYLASVVAEPDIASIHRASASHRVRRYEEILAGLRADGDLADDVDIPLTSRQLLATTMGLALQVMFEPESWPPERQLVLVDSQLRPLFRPERMPVSLGGEARGKAPAKAGR